MALDLAALPDDVDALHRLIRELAAERAGERKALSEAQTEIERLRLIVQKLQRLQFGRRAERSMATNLSWDWRIWVPTSPGLRDCCRLCRPSRYLPRGIDQTGRVCPIIWNART
jgi:hypothetical protein